MPQSPSTWAPWDLTQFSQSPSAAPSCFPASHRWSEISSLSKVILVWGKGRSPRVPDLGWEVGCWVIWFDVSPKNSVRDVMHEQVHCREEAANLQLPIAVAFWIIQMVSMEGCSSLMQNLIQIHCFTRSLILNTHAQSTEPTAPHWLVQWSHHCSHLHIPIHSPRLPGYTDIAQTVLIATMAGLFLDRPHMGIYIFIERDWQTSVSCSTYLCIH